MNCADPFVKAGQAFGCGQCLVCRTQRTRIWMHRIILEATQYESNAFLTLTYSDDKIPEGGTLVPSHSRDFLKRLRHAVLPERFRYFLVGEYGDQTQRPHYHAVLFNYPQCEWGQSRYSASRNDCCAPCDTIRNTWGLGHVFLGAVNPESASYVSGYVVKKLNRKEPTLGQRYPEFSRMSNRPGIGAGFMDDVADSLLRSPEVLAHLGDVPSSLSHGPRQLPLGRYLRRNLRTKVGMPPNAPEITLQKMAEKLQMVREHAFQNSASFKKTLLNSTLGARTNIENRARIYKKDAKI